MKHHIATLLACAALLGAAAPVAAGTLAGSAMLRSLHASMAGELANNAFGEPLVIRSQEASGRIEGHAYAVLDVSFAQLAPLAERPQWCELMMLHLNNKYCRTSDDEGTPRVELFVGRKHEQPVTAATRLRFAWMPAAQRSDYAAVRMAAPDGPYDTRDYALAFEAVPLDAGRSFIHLGYAFTYGGTSRFAMQLYLATVGRDKVGFSREEGGDARDPAFVGGMRGVVERNVMRYILAIRAHVAANGVPAAQRLDARLQAWFAATERYPRQLHEVSQAEYLRMKHSEFRRLAAPQ